MCRSVLGETWMSERAFRLCFPGGSLPRPFVFPGDGRGTETTRIKGSANSAGEARPAVTSMSLRAVDIARMVDRNRLVAASGGIC